MLGRFLFRKQQLHQVLSGLKTQSEFWQILKWKLMIICLRVRAVSRALFRNTRSTVKHLVIWSVRVLLRTWDTEACLYHKARTCKSMLSARMPILLRFTDVP